MLQSTPKSQYLGILSWDLHCRGPGQINDTMWPKVSHTLTRDSFISWSQLGTVIHLTGRGPRIKPLDISAIKVLVLPEIVLF